MEESNLKLIKKQFKAARNYWKNKKDVKFVFVGKSLCCNKFNQIFYTNQINGNKCCECLNEIRYKIKSKCHHCGKNYKMNLEQKKNGRKFSDLVGCTKEHLISHIESKFTPKMSWDNYGTYWHIDHIIPISSFDLSDQDQRKAANHWTNLQPLEASKNIAKSNKMINPQPQLMLEC